MPAVAEPKAEVKRELRSTWLTVSPASPSSVKLTWNPVQNASGFKVFQVDIPTGEAKLLASVGRDTLELEAQITPGVVASFYVRSFNDTGSKDSEARRIRLPILVDSWKKPQLSEQVVANLREMLCVPEDDDLPEALLLTLASIAAVDRSFIENDLSKWQLVQAVLMSGPLSQVFSAPGKFASGETVVVKSRGKPAAYVCPGPMGMELVNFYGLFALVPAGDIQKKS